MREQKKNIVCILIFVFALLAGVCFENIEADAFELYSNHDHLSSTSVYERQNFSDAEPWTTVSTLAKRNAGFNKNTQGNARRTAYKLIGQLLCTDHFSLLRVNQVNSPKNNLECRIGSRVVLTNYIHRTDGKKRI